MKKRESLFKYQSRIYNGQRKSDVNHRGVKMRFTNKIFPSFNFIKAKISSYGSKRVIRHHHYHIDPKLDPCIVAIISTPCSFHVWTTILSLS